MAAASAEAGEPERLTASALAEREGVSRAAAELFLATDVIDLHIDTFIPPRLPLVRYDVEKRHRRGFLGGRFFGHLDLPRVLESGLTGAMWSITTNPFRRAKRRWVVFQKNFQRFQELVGRHPERLRLVRTAAEYRAARDAGRHAVMCSIQGGNALEKAPDWLDSIAWPDGEPSPIVRVTLVHLTNAAFGITSSPFRLWKGKRGLSDAGKAFVEHLDQRRVFVDLAHINRAGFWDAVDVHDKTLPLIATHTGVCGVKPHWRNLDNRQIRAIADSGGVVGIIFAKNFLKPRGGPTDANMIVDHMAHVIDIGGEDAVAVGSDYDGAIVPPKDMRNGTSYVRLVDKMLERGFSEDLVQKALGGNFLRSFAALRG